MRSILKKGTVIKMAIFALSDTHLSFADNKPMDVFGNRWRGYTDKLSDGWRSVVTADDTVIIPGDISWAMSVEGAREDLLFLDSLPGRKIIGKGNHDYWWETAKKMHTFFNENGITTIDLLYNNSYSIDGVDICGARGWFSDEKSAPRDADYKKIVNRECQRLSISIEASKDSGNEERLVFLHFPPVFKSYLCREIVDCMHKYNIKKCYFGHIHNVYEFPQSFDFEGIEFTMISADYLNFVPLRIK